MAKNIKVPQYVSGSPASDLLGYVSNKLDDIGKESLRNWEISRINEAEREGLLEGTSENVQYRESGTLTSEAFNKAALKTHLANLRAGSNIIMDRYKVMDSGNPDEYKRHTDDYINKIVTDLKKSPVIEPHADLLEKQLKLRQQSDGYRIVKEYNQKLIDSKQAAVTSEIDSLKSSVYSIAGFVHSKDNREVLNTFISFGLAKKQLVNSLNETVNDLPIYNEQEKENILSKFNSDFFSYGIEHWINESDIDLNDELNLLHGTYNIGIPGSDVKINIIDEIGVDKYHNEIVPLVRSKMKEQVQISKSKEADAERNFENLQKINGFKLIYDVKTKGIESSDIILKKVTSGEVLPTDGKMALNAFTSEKVNLDDTEIVTIANDMIAHRTDASSFIKKHVNALSPGTFIELSKANSQAQGLERRNILSEIERKFKNEFVQKDSWGFALNPASERDYNDLVASFRDDISGGMNLEAASEKLRETGRFVKDLDLDMAYKEVEPYLRFTEKNKLDVKSTIYDIGIEGDSEYLTSEEQIILIDRIENLIREGKLEYE